MSCPCVSCLNGRRLDVVEIREHLLFDGFSKNYTRWTWHGVLIGILNVFETQEFVD